jgi:hypothetical protein
MPAAKTSAKTPRAARVRPALAAQLLHDGGCVARVRAPWSGAARPRVGFASTSPTTRPHRADGRVPGGRLGENARTGWMGQMRSEAAMVGVKG